MTIEAKLTGVAGEEYQPKQVRETTPDQREWIERCVWTDRMLKRLEETQEETVWFSLWDKVGDRDNLTHAAWNVIWNEGSPGVDHQTTEAFRLAREKEIEKLAEELRTGTYKPLPARRTWIEKLGSTDLRPLGIPPVRDRVVQTALKHVIEPILERDFARESYGFRPGKSAHQAIRRVEEELEQGRQWIVDADLKSYFDTIPHDRLMEKVRRRIADGGILKLIESYLNAGILEVGKGWQETTQGTPQGSVISPLLANLYLNDLDHEMERKGRKMVRYADDFVVLCTTKAEAEEVLEEIKRWVKQEGLSLHPTKTKIVSLKEGFDFLGFHFQEGREGRTVKWPRKKSVAKLRETIRERTRRLSGEAMGAIIASINPTLRGWHAYFRTSQPSALEGIDGWIRRRLRSILRFRDKKAGISKGHENRPYPNRWFQEYELFSLAGYPDSKASIPQGNY
jgi:RNA-directed DNA polymerase